MAGKVVCSEWVAKQRREVAVILLERDGGQDAY